MLNSEDDPELCNITSRIRLLIRICYPCSASSQVSRLNSRPCSHSEEPTEPDMRLLTKLL